MKIIYNENTMSVNVNREVEHIASQITTALNMSRQMNVPADFSRKNDVYYTRSTIASAKLDILRYDQWLDRLKMNYNRVEEEHQINIQRIQNIEIKIKPNLL